MSRSALYGLLKCLPVSFRFVDAKIWEKVDNDDSLSANICWMAVFDISRKCHNFVYWKVSDRLLWGILHAGTWIHF